MRKGTVYFSFGSRAVLPSVREKRRWYLACERGDKVFVNVDVRHAQIDFERRVKEIDVPLRTRVL